VRLHAGLLALFVGAFCIASSAIWVRLSELGPVATAFWRVALALPLLWAWAARVSLTDHLEAGRRFGWPLAAAGVCFAGDLALWHGSIVLTSVANATLLANFAPVFVTLAVWLLSGRRPHARFLLALAVALAGIRLAVEHIRLVQGGKHKVFDVSLHPTLRLAAKADD
jgi:drug/metabolite transporter (DMT)-like permease